jgi:uncharacterized membrane protein
MARTIGNPLSWFASTLGSIFGYAGAAVGSVGAHDEGPPEVRELTYDDLRRALRKGAEDLARFRSDVVFICLLYPAMGIVLVTMAFRIEMFHLIFPVLSGFALLGPVAAVGLYEMSRRHEKGQPTSWLAYIDVLRSPKFGGIVALGLFHIVVFMAWIMVANLIFRMTIGPEVPATFADFAQRVLTTPEGWSMIVVGTGIGFCFALAVLAISVVSFPLFLDRNVGLPVAVVTSIRVALRNPRPIGAWGLIVAVLLAVGSLPALLGLVLVMPLLGHATWHLYRAAVK